MESSTFSSNIHQVIIIGAGISGLSAARHLRKNGVTNIIILEATSKPGGRIQTQVFGKGIIELGAQWIHGEQNEFCQLVKASNHRNVKTSWEGKGDFLCPDGSKVDDALVDEVLGWIEDSIETVESTFSIETLQEGTEGNTVTSMGQHLLDSFLLYMKERHPNCEELSPEYQTRMALFQWGMSFQRIDNSCNRMNDVSLYRWSEFQVNPGEHYNNFARGAQPLVDEVLVDFHHPFIIYNSPVRNINWEAGSRQVKVTTEEGTTYLANTVLVTVSVGVLQSQLRSLFTPSLPENLSQAIRSTGYGPVTKIFLEWAKPWWQSNLKGLQLVWPKEYLDCCDGCGQQQNLNDVWHKAITGFDPVLDNPGVLLAWLGGPEALHVEKLSDKQVTERCVQVLKHFTKYNVPLPEKVAVSKWNTNRYFKGAYSFRSVEGDSIKGDICALMSEPVYVKDEHGENRPVIVLAGEAFSRTHYSTLHGAFESGIAQAAKIVQYFNTTLSSSTVAKVVHTSGKSSHQHSSLLANAEFEIEVPS